MSAPNPPFFDLIVALMGDSQTARPEDLELLATVLLNIDEPDELKIAITCGLAFAAEAEKRGADEISSSLVATLEKAIPRLLEQEDGASRQLVREQHDRFSAFVGKRAPTATVLPRAIETFDPNSIPRRV